MATIRDLVQRDPTGWRQRLLPAHFDGKTFHTEVGSMEGGRRIVTHEFPKRELPYSEDMGKKATEFSVRGYIIQFVKDTGIDLYRRDYTFARNLLQERLDTGGPGTLQLPMMRPMKVVCSRYRMNEEDKLGGYVTFDMTFVELGAPPFMPAPNAVDALLQQAQNLKDQVISALSPAAGVKGAVSRTPAQIASGNPIPLGQ